jgi:Polyketide cyclase / dehydrase and lipid transport
LVLGSGVCRAGEEIGVESPNDGWQLATERHEVKIYSRVRAGSAVKEFKAVGAITASSRAVYRVLNDIAAYPSFMPYTVECRLLKREGDMVWAYQRLKPPLCRPRDYTLCVRETTRPGDGGLIYHQQWESANDEGPAAQAGVVRVEICEGGWLLEPHGGALTLATYSVFTDCGGALPAFIANRASEIAIPRVFEAIRRQVRLPKYQTQQE